MATFYEPRWHAREREARDQERYWELAFSDLDELLRIDRANLRDGEPLTSFGRTVIDVFARVGVSPEERREIEAQTRKDLLARAAQSVETPPPDTDLDPFTAAVAGGGLGPLAPDLAAALPVDPLAGPPSSFSPLPGEPPGAVLPSDAPFATAPGGAPGSPGPLDPLAAGMSDPLAAGVAALFGGAPPAP